jgi:hypothetical protein
MLYICILGLIVQGRKVRVQSLKSSFGLNEMERPDGNRSYPGSLFNSYTSSPLSTSVTVILTTCPSIIKLYKAESLHISKK